MDLLRTDRHVCSILGAEAQIPAADHFGRRIARAS
jgi:hypothetical protein